ncbi:MAG: YciI family protein [Thermomicrobiales bacterium]
MPKFVAILRFQNNEQRLHVRPRHREYLGSLLAEGKLVLSGPFADDSGALIIYEAESEKEVRDLIAADPYTSVDAIGDLQVREWKQVLPP